MHDYLVSWAARHPGFAVSALRRFLNTCGPGPVQLAHPRYDPLRALAEYRQLLWDFALEQRMTD